MELASSWVDQWYLCHGMRECCVVFVGQSIGYSVETVRYGYGMKRHVVVLVAT